ncbi:hypothetical protein PR202_ga24060 [Eleusine coracana subsp. coracana]|uniref:Disease resistance R13L4/SHOC-2-like LRR domain-containing protein n=1 Tax=Eleusine coracana subsp. coracana TaxID=191504 RepID=A0AAV5D848_ELECO|nr:hypothetical protein PR202_ga24060 [Eleusine coracana subsp. coracana]
MKNNSLSLTFVDISLSQVRPEDLQALGALSSLRAIRLWSQSCFHNPQMRMKVNAGGFPSTRACAFLDFATVPSIFAPGAMLHVQQLEFCIWVWKFTSGGSGFGTTPAVVERVEAALRQAAEDHPNRLALRINKCMTETELGMEIAIWPPMFPAHLNAGCIDKLAPARRLHCSALMPVLLRAPSPALLRPAPLLCPSRVGTGRAALQRRGATTSGRGRHGAELTTGGEARGGRHGGQSPAAGGGARDGVRQLKGEAQGMRAESGG